MGMNFQDQPSGEKEKQPGSSFDDPRVDDIFLDSPSGGRTLLWIALAVVVLAIIGGGIYALNKYGYFSFLRKKPAVTVVTATPAPQAPRLTAPPAKAPTSKPIPTADKFAIQVSAFQRKLAADQFAAKLKQSGLDAYVYAGKVPRRGTWYKVCVGPYDSKVHAIAAIQMVKEKVGSDAWVVPAQ
jgi:hypothetical protein